MEGYATVALDYLPIFIFLVVALGMAGFMTTAAFFIGKRPYDKRKLVPYECGFDAFTDARRKFDVRFYLIAILFIIFDLEIAFLFPWSISLEALGAEGFFSMMVFLTLLTIGFIYEWKKGALEWE